MNLGPLVTSDLRLAFIVPVTRFVISIRNPKSEIRNGMVVPGSVILPSSILGAWRSRRG
jgi:hypothetical protein